MKLQAIANEKKSWILFSLFWKQTQNPLNIMTLEVFSLLFKNRQRNLYICIKICKSQFKYLQWEKQITKCN